MKTRKALESDLERMLEIEESAISGYGYLLENKDFYFDGIQNQGEMILALKEEFPVGMGQYSVLPDGSGWLEILRVHKDYQRQGAGLAIYRRYMELTQETNAPSVAMFTGRRNIASKTLAEKHGFTLATAHFEYTLDLTVKINEIPEFHLIQSDKYKSIHPEYWGEFIGLNRTYFHLNESTIQWLYQKNMIYTDDESILVLGSRMLKHRGWYIGYMSGDIEKCIQFAIYRTQAEKLPKLTISIPIERTDLHKAVEKAGFKLNGELIVMERKFKTLEK